ncbi:MAG: hypothetical protein R2754_17610 [Microthrixaceae bacterium]
MTDVRRLDQLSRAELAVLGREYLLAGHLIDRAGMPHAIGRWGRDGMAAIAIDEWMGASPVYTPRMARALGFAGDSVETIFKGMQLDIGAPPEFMDFRYRVIDHNHGEFTLAHCGALMDVEPMGADYVETMCHHIEDPTFDATAYATNPRAVMRPVHRPPRRPVDRQPHCQWTVDIDPLREPLGRPQVTDVMASTLAAGTSIAPFGPAGGPGMADYSGPLDPNLALEHFNHRALSIICQEAALQGHLLAMSFMAAIERRHGVEAAVEVGTRQFVGIAGLAADRLRRAFGLGDGLADIAQVIELHPAFAPRPYVDRQVGVGADLLSLRLLGCEAAAETAAPTWVAILAGLGAEAAGAEVLGAIARAVNPRANCRNVEDRGQALAGWEVTLGEVEQPEAEEVALARFSTGAEFQFGRTAGSATGSDGATPVDLRR